MSKASKIEQYHAAYADLQNAKERLLAATKAAWPIGMQVISNKFIHGMNGKPIPCTVLGHCEWYDHGALILRNNRTGKTHRAWPHSAYQEIPGVVPA